MHAADIQDRDGGELVMATLFGMFPFLLKLYADGGYQGPLFRAAVRKVMKQVNVEICRVSNRKRGERCVSMKANSVIFPLTNPSQPPDKGRRLATSARPCQKSQIRAEFALSQRSSGECRLRVSHAEAA